MSVRYLPGLGFRAGQRRSLKMVGDPSSNIAVGDIVAFWGRDAGARLDVPCAHDYNTVVGIVLIR